MTNRKAAKELLHIQGWLERVDEIIRRGERLTLPTTCFKRPATRG